MKILFVVCLPFESLEAGRDCGRILIVMSVLEIKFCADARDNDCRGVRASVSNQSRVWSVSRTESK